jgi:predicted methyltransferase
MTNPQKQPPITQRAHELILEVLQPGDIAVDATIGNGHDTLFLAQAVGEKGKVYGFDIQQDALDATYKRLQKHHMENRVSLFHAGHEVMPILLPENIKGSVKAIMFNLGYLPGGDKTRTTHISTTLSALEAALHLLNTGGRITILAYTGHPGGTEETNAIIEWANQIPNDLYQTLIEIPAEKNIGQNLTSSPELIWIEKL